MTSDEKPEVAGIPFNRLVAFLGPYIAIASGAVADWLLVHLHFLGLFHFQHDGLATGIAQLVVFILTAGVTWLGHQTWLKGHHIDIAAQKGLESAVRAVLADSVANTTPEELVDDPSDASSAALYAPPPVEYDVGDPKPDSSIKPDNPHD